jgi:hypothetical protein
VERLNEERATLTKRRSGTPQTPPPLSHVPTRPLAGTLSVEAADITRDPAELRRLHIKANGPVTAQTRAVPFRGAPSGRQRARAEMRIYPPRSRPNRFGAADGLDLY